MAPNDPGDGIGGCGYKNMKTQGLMNELLPVVEGLERQSRPKVSSVPFQHSHRPTDYIMQDFVSAAEVGVVNH